MQYDNQSENIGELAKSLAKAQLEMGAATKSARNPHFKSSFADLSSVLEAIKPALNNNGIAVIQKARKLMTNESGMPVYGVVLTTMLIHSSGQWISDEGLFVPAGKADAHGVGSALTYARRYGLAAMVGLQQKDDDGIEAVNSTTAHKTAANIKPPVRS